MVGDSIMVCINSLYNGWGEYFFRYFIILVVNKVIFGCFVCSFINEGCFVEIECFVVFNDIVIISFGYNDGSFFNLVNDNGCSVCFGIGNEVCRLGKIGEMVYMYNYYF